MMMEATPPWEKTGVQTKTRLSESGGFCKKNQTGPIGFHQF
jgi:hypothetical protein